MDAVKNISKASEKAKRARLKIMELANMMSVPMSLNAVVNLKVADAIWQGGSNTPLSASQILSRILPSGKGDAENLERFIRLLARYDVFEEHVFTTSDGPESRYSLTDVGQTLVADSNGISHGLYVLQHHKHHIMNSWPLAHEAVLDPITEPFVKANGKTPYEYYSEHPEMNDAMIKAMAGVSASFMKGFLEGYHGFKAGQAVVDVGGSTGLCLGMILKKHPTIGSAINYDLPEVIKEASLNPVGNRV